MGNTQGGGSGSWRNETVTSASYVSRPMSSGSSSSGSGGSRHDGVVVTTNEGNKYLIHHPGPGSTTTVTSASNMSKAWVKDHDITVSGSKSVQEVYNGAGGRTTNPVINYITAGTCVGAAKGAETTLTKK